MYTLLETIEKGKKCILLILSNWCDEDFYYWPGNKKYHKFLTRQVTRNESWTKLEYHRVLRTKIGKILYNIRIFIIKTLITILCIYIY